MNFIICCMRHAATTTTTSATAITVLNILLDKIKKFKMHAKNIIINVVFYVLLLFYSLFMAYLCC